LILCAAAILAVSDLTISVKFGDGSTSAESRTQQVIEEGGGDAPEYLPADAARHGWFDPTHPGQDNQMRAADFTSKCLQRSDRELSRDLKFDVRDCSGKVVLPQFYFPGWAAVVGTTALPVFPDPVSGLASVVLGPGSKTVLLRRKMLGGEQLGAAISIAFIMSWGVLACLMVRLPQGMRRGRNASAVSGVSTNAFDVITTRLARRRRAARLREQIADLATPAGSSADAGQDAPAASHPEQRGNAPRVHPASPRSFVERRMRELDEGDRGKKD
jgi:hypothetical protein